MQYTRNTVTGASTAERGRSCWSTRGTACSSRPAGTPPCWPCCGVPQLVLAVNKIDLVGYDETVFAAIAKEFLAYATALGYRDADVIAIPVSRAAGRQRGRAVGATCPGGAARPCCTTWKSCRSTSESPHAPLRFPVQFVIRPGTEEHRDYRGYAGQIAAGTAQPGDEVVVLPAGQRTTIAGIDTMDGALAAAGPGSVGHPAADRRHRHLPRRPDRRRERRAEAGHRLDATLCWLTEAPLRAGMRVLVKHGTRTTQAMIAGLRSRFDEQNLTSLPAPEFLRLNEIGQVCLATAEPLPVDDYTTSRRTGCFLVIDPQDGTTLAAGLIGRPAWGRVIERAAAAV